MVQNFHIAGIPQLALGRSQLTLNNHFSAGVRQIHLRTLDRLNFTGHTIHYITTFTFGNGDCVMENLAVIVNNSVFRTRIINHLVITSDKQLFANRMDNLIVIFVFGNYLSVDTRNLRQLNCSEDVRVRSGSHKGFSRLGENYLGAMDITLVTIFIL